MSHSSERPTPRFLLHTRTLELKCFERSDGLFEVEGHLGDEKPFDLKLSDGTRRHAGTPIHDLWLRLTVNAEREIVAVEASMPVPAHASCDGARSAYDNLVGVRIGPGWIQEARERIADSSGCTHLSEMLQQLGTTLLQGMYGHYHRRERPGKKLAPIKDGLLDSCFGLRRGGALDRMRRQRQAPELD
jgi:hypothetical protein